MNGEGRSDIGLIQLGGDHLVEREGEVNEGHQLQHQIEEGNDAAERTVGNNPRVALNAPDEQPSHEEQHHEEDAHEHVMRPRPSEGAEEEEEEGGSDRGRDSVHDLNAVRSENLVQL